MKARKPSAITGKRASRSAERWELSLYVTDQNPKSLEAVRNLRAFCNEYLSGRCKIEVVDLLAQPARAIKDQIIAVPTIIRRRPLPPLTMVGDFTKIQHLFPTMEIKDKQKR